jgi:predicted nucleotidyltransferase component of viral defense system
MIRIEQIRGYFPPLLHNTESDKQILKEYLELMVLNFLSSTKFARKIVFIGGTNLRLIKGIDRFSEYLDFDCNDFTHEEFFEMTDTVIRFLNNSGFNAQAKDKENEKLIAYRRSIYFPELLFDMELSGHKEARFLMKIESQNQGFLYTPKSVNIQGCGFFFPFSVPPDDILCSMKLTALLTRAKGRDFYDAMFLLSQTQPNYDYLTLKQRIHNLSELKTKLAEILEEIDLQNKSKDFEHLLFDKNNSNKILKFSEFIQNLKE